MSGYIIAGYAAAFGSLGVYGATLLARERAARRRLAPVAVKHAARGVTRRRTEPDASSAPVPPRRSGDAPKL